MTQIQTRHHAGSLPFESAQAPEGRGAAQQSRHPKPVATFAQDQLLGRLTGLFFIITFATSIPAALYLYVPALTNPAFVLGDGFDVDVSLGAFLELLLVAANIATALTLYPVLRRYSTVLSLGFLTARITESAFIAMGIVAMLALNTLRLQGGDADPDTQILVGRALVALHDWTFRLGPGFVVGIGNGLILGYLLWTTRLVPRTMSILGLIGGPGLLLTGTLIVFGSIEAGSTAQIIATVPEFFWELSLGFWLLVRGFDSTALTSLRASHD